MIQLKTIIISEASKHKLVWLIILNSLFTYFIFTRHGLDAIALWFMPASLTELTNPLSIVRIWTPVFVHYTFLHLVTNLYLWWLFASKIETESRVELVVIVLIAAAFSNLCQWWIVDEKFGGLSGVVYALMAYSWIVARYGGMPNYRFDPILGILLLALIPLTETGLFGKFATYAHLGGLLCGAVMAMFYIIRKKNQ